MRAKILNLAETKPENIKTGQFLPLEYTLNSILMTFKIYTYHYFNPALISPNKDPNQKCKKNFCYFFNIKLED